MGSDAQRAIMSKNQHKAVLVITDGIGHNPDSDNNAFAAATKPTYSALFENAPHSLIKTSGAAVGLPDGQMGNSEVGHMTLGSGRVLERRTWLELAMSLMTADCLRTAG